MAIARTLIICQPKRAMASIALPEMYTCMSAGEFEWQLGRETRAMTNLT